MAELANTDQMDTQQYMYTGALYDQGQTNDASPTMTSTATTNFTSTDYQNTYDMPATTAAAKGITTTDQKPHVNMGYLWKSLIIISAILALAGVVIGVLSMQRIATPKITTSDIKEVTVDPTSLNIARWDSKNFWNTFTPTACKYKVLNGCVALTIDFTFTPVVSSTISSTIIEYNITLPVKIAQPFGYGSATSTNNGITGAVTALNNVARCTGLATLSSMRWRPFADVFSGSRDEVLHLKFIRWDDPFINSQNVYTNDNTFITTNGTGTGTVTIYYYSDDPTL